MRTISPDEVSTAKADLGLAIVPTFNIATLSRIHRILRSEYVISGAYIAMGNQPGDSIHIDVHVQDANSGETVSSFGEDGTIGTLSAALRRAGKELFSRLGIQDRSGGGNTNVKTTCPSIRKLYGCTPRASHGCGFLTRWALEICCRSLSPSNPTSLYRTLGLLEHGNSLAMMGRLAMRQRKRSHFRRTCRGQTKNPSKPSTTN